MVKSPASHWQCGPKSIPSVEAKCGLSCLLFVVGSLHFSETDVFLRVLRFLPHLRRQHFQISIRPGMIDEESLRGCATPKSLACENIPFSSLFARRARRNGCFRRLLNRYLFIYLFIKLTKFGLIKTSPVLAGASFHPKTRKVLNRKSNSSSIKY